ncbi:MAG: hypothetical protein CBC25_04135 [Pelagibacteraceae bacterium TMED65]|nr:hypothetical protein [Rickettsiales bacterium]OUU52058.1 MAG: hypothetical protein CBC25_04135 [Pelagibacteraceae bacterium TMED65]|tara:strand:- start:640 stop:867 length:228 start_codon:yes stop_codon:yes gene_type:complete
MKTIIRSNNQVYISWVKNILNINNIKYFVLDEEMSVMEGNITAIPVRILVDEKDLYLSKEIIQKAEKKLNSTQTY